MSLIQIDRTVFKRLLLYTKSLEDRIYNDENLEGLRELRNKLNNDKTIDEQIDAYVEFSKQLNNK